MSEAEGLERADPDDRHLVRWASESREDDAEVGERLEVERAGGRWTERLCAGLDSPVTVRTGDGVTHEGVLTDVGRGWMVLQTGEHSVLVMSAAAVLLLGLPSRGASASPAARGVGWPYRRWGRMRSAVSVFTSGAGRLEGEVIEVLADAVVLRTESGADALVPFDGMVWARGPLLHTVED